MTAEALWWDGQDVADVEVEILAGIEQLKLHTGEIEALAQRCDAPVTGRSSWILAAVSHGPESSAVLVRDAAGFLKAAAVLVTATGHDTVSLAGAGPGSFGHRGALLADDATWARRLGVALQLNVSAHGRHPAVEFGPIAADSVGLDDLLAGFPGLIASPADPIPMIRRQPGLDQAADYLTGAMRRTLRKATNRLSTDDRRFEIRFARGYSDIAALLPVIEACHRDRDHDRGLTSDLDDEAGRETWRNRLLALARDGLLEVSTGHIDGELAAHVVGIRDRSAYRVLEGHFATAWARYAPGRLLETAVIQRMLDEPTMSLLDWMTSVAPESLVAQNDAQPVVVLRTPPGS